MMEQLRIQTTLLKLVSDALFHTQGAAELSEDILQEARAQSVSGLLQTDYQLLGNAIRVNKAHADLTEALSGIPFVTLKGYVSASYYPIPEKRAMGDVDFYVAEEHYEAAADRLLEQGYNPAGGHHQRHETFTKDGVLFELHSEIKGIPNGKDGVATASSDAEAVVRRYLSDVIETAVHLPTQYGTIVCPDAFHHGLIMLLHLAGHIVNDGGIGLRHLCDWAVYADKIDVSAFETQLREMGLWTFACLLTAACCRNLGLRDMQWAGEPDVQITDALLGDIFRSGNFSNKASGRAFAVKMQQNGAFTALAELVKKRYKFCRTQPWLLPIGIVLYGCFYLRKRINGQLKWVSVATLADGKQRAELFETFKLFDIGGEK